MSKKGIRILFAEPAYGEGEAWDLADALRRVVQELEDDPECKIALFFGEKTDLLHFQITESESASERRTP